MNQDKVPLLVTELPGPKAKAILEVESRLGSPSYSRGVPLVWESAADCIVTDVDGNRFLDFTSGVVVANVGHSHPRVVKALQEQAERLITCYDAAHDPRRALMEKLVSILPGDDWRILLLSTGSEAVESAIKLARNHTSRHEIVAFEGSFHGRTYGALSATGFTSMKRNFGPMMSGFLAVPFPNCYRCSCGNDCQNCSKQHLELLERLLLTQSSGDVAAVLMEPYLGSGGCIFPPQGFLAAIRDFCDRHNLLLILDEIQSGFGRTGKMFAFEYESIVPDIVCLAKGLNSGVPTSVVAAREGIFEGLPAGSITSTNAGNPLSCAVSSATIDVLIEEGLCQRAAEAGEYLLGALRQLQAKYEFLGDVRGRGLAIAVEIVATKAGKEPRAELARKIAEDAFRKGLVLLPPVGIHKNAIRINPPLTISYELIDKGTAILADVFAGLSAE